MSAGLSFREQAAIALATSVQANHYNVPTTEQNRFWSHDVQSAAVVAQDLADACCAKWGHAVEYDRDKCERCGQKLTGAEVCAVRGHDISLPFGTTITKCARCGAEVEP